jgi:membrane-bound serine protease (ClpP class)
MMRLRALRRASVRWTALAILIVVCANTATARAQAPPAAAAAADQVVGCVIPVVEPITDEVFTRVRNEALQVISQSAGRERGANPILIFEFLPGESEPGKSQLGICYELATFIAQELGGAKMTVAFVPSPLSGYAVLPAIACGEIVMGSKASLGPITPAGQSVRAAFREPVRALALSSTRDPDLLLGMLDPDADLRLIRTSDKSLHYVLSSNLKKFLETHDKVDDQPAWEGGERGVLTATRARKEGFCKRIADSRAEVASLYQLSGHSVADDPVRGQTPNPAWIKLEGPLDTVMISYLTRGLEQARQAKVNLLFVQINCTGGNDAAADRLADLLLRVRDMKTVAYVSDRAMGVAALLPLACRDIIFSQTGRMGDVRQTMSARNSRLHDLSEEQIASLSKKAAALARAREHPEAVALAMIDPSSEVIEAKDLKTGAARVVSREQMTVEPGRYQAIRTRKAPGAVLTVTADDVASYGLAQVVSSDDELKALYSLRGKAIRVEEPGWIDTLVTILTDPFVSWMLLFVGGFMLVLELKLPGIGLPGIISALAFLLFFWSHYLSGTADQLEIILFLVGLVCLALEMFVFPGFGIFGMSGILLMLASIVMASHTFVWPTTDYEYRELGHTLLQMTGMLAAIGTGAGILARYLPALPLFNRLVLRPEPWTGVEPADSLARPNAEGYDSLAFLIGESGRTATTLRPSGKARFGNHLIDVTADGAFVEPDSLVEVVDVQGSRVIVKPVVD